MSSSLAAQNQLVAPKDLVLPPMVVQPRATGDYAFFAQPKAEEQFRSLLPQFPMVEEGHQFLCREGKMVHISPMSFFLLAARQYFAVTDPSGNELERYGSNDMSNTRKERVHAAIVILHKGEAIPATITAKTTKCPSMTTLYRAVAMPFEQWVNETGGPSEQSKQVESACPEQWMRFVGTITLRTRTSKSSKKGYVVADSTVRLSGPDDWLALGKLMNEPASLHRTMNVFVEWVKSLNIKD